MKYADGRDIHLGDIIEEWADGCKARVVCVIGREEYSDAYTKEQWGYLKSGFLIESEQAGLIHYADSDKNMRLIDRNPKR